MGKERRRPTTRLPDQDMGGAVQRSAQVGLPRRPNGETTFQKTTFQKPASGRWGCHRARDLQGSAPLLLLLLAVWAADPYRRASAALLKPPRRLPIGQCRRRARRR